jgi:hypothetical protein
LQHKSISLSNAHPEEDPCVNLDLAESPPWNFFLQLKRGKEGGAPAFLEEEERSRQQKEEHQEQR